MANSSNPGGASSAQSQASSALDSAGSEVSSGVTSNPASSAVAGAQSSASSAVSSVSDATYSNNNNAGAVLTAPTILSPVSLTVAAATVLAIAGSLFL